MRIACVRAVWATTRLMAAHTLGQRTLQYGASAAMRAGLVVRGFFARFFYALYGGVDYGADC
jgi:hypothetical protein